MTVYNCNYSLTQQPIKTKLGIHIHFNKHNTIITLHIVINLVVLIGSCVSELHGHPIVMYCLRLFIVVLQELHCLQICNFPIPCTVIDIIYQYAIFRFSTLSGY